MKYGFSNTFHGHDCLVIGFFSDETTINGLSTAGQRTVDSLSQHIEKHTALLQYQPQDIDSTALVLINCGKKDDYDNNTFLKIAETATKQVIKSHAITALFHLPQLTSQTNNWQYQQLVLVCEGAAYQFNAYKQDKKPTTLEMVAIYGSENDESPLEEAANIAQGIAMARDLGNHPGNVCTPTYLAQTAIELANSHANLSTKIIDKTQMQALGMGALLGVAQGSDEEPKLIEMNYQGGPKDQAPIVLVGKGITFDSGGISLKPGSGMDEMKYDMCGAASVFGAIKALCLMQLPINVIGLVASAENMPSGRALKPGDIVTTMSGQTVEITNTDAEGRLILCDALTYAERYKPVKVLDMATLTGAMVISLGAHYTGFFTTDDALANEINHASQMSKDKAWRLPLDDCYKSQLESGVADMINASTSRAAGSITAAYYLSNFTKQYPWAHLDIAGTAWKSGAKNTATGRPVALLSQFLINAANQ